MTPSGNHDQPIELVEKSLGTTPLVGKVFTFGPPYATLNAVLVQSAKNLFERGLKFESVKPEGLAGRERAVRRLIPGKRTNLRVLPVLFATLRVHPISKMEPVSGLIQQRLAMVCERE
jgi:hypothetical protein